MIYLDNAATTWPKPPAVPQAVLRGMRELGANPGRGGYAMGQQAAEAVYRCREELAAFFDTPGPECVVFQPGCTQAINLVLQGLLRPGDHVLRSDLEHNAVLRPLAALEQRGIEVSAAPVTPQDSAATMEAFRRAMRPNTRLVVCTHASNVFGIRLPVERIAALCHQYGALLCVDAAQTAGLLPIRLRESGVDFVCCAGHKGLYGPMGIGLLLLRDPSLLPQPLVFGGTGSNSRSTDMPELPERYEAGTVNLPGILGLQAGLAFVRRRGPQNLLRQELALTASLYDRLSSLRRVRLYTDRPQEPWHVPVLSFTAQGIPSEELAQRLGKQGFALRAGLHCAPAAHEKFGTLDAGTLRVSPGAFSKPGDVQALAGALERMGL